jgi:probable rRNA maturation factor
MNSLRVEINFVVEPGADVSIDNERIESLARFVLSEEGATDRWEVAVVLTTDKRLRDLHRQFMGIDSETDVMTFPSDPIEGESQSSGDIVISVDRAAEQGIEFGHSREQEIEYLIVHGVLHLCGWNDRDDNDREKMLMRQDELIEGFNASWPQLFA